jgi:excisionase family DNA binding protein
MRGTMAKIRSVLRALIDTTPSSIILDNVNAAEETPFEELLDVQEAAKLLRIHPKTLQAIARSGEVPCLRMGKYWRFRASSLDAWVESGLSCVNQSRRVQ